MWKVVDKILVITFHKNGATFYLQTNSTNDDRGFIKFI